MLAVWVGTEAEMRKFITIITIALLLCTSLSAQVRLKDISSIEGVRTNALTGFGIVVGLNGSGDKDQTRFTTQALANALVKSGLNVDPTAFRVKNVAAVLVQAELPPFATSGSRIDVSVSSIGDAISLQGGMLLITDLKGVDGQVYAQAQGPLSIGGFAAGGGGASAVKNHPTVGRIPNGGMVERAIPFEFQSGRNLRFVLDMEDFTTMQRAVTAVNQYFGEPHAFPLNSRIFEVRVPEGMRPDMVRLVSVLENLELDPDAVAKIVINERTGTIVIGDQVRVSRVAIAHGNLTIRIDTTNVAVPSGAQVGGADTVIETNTTTEVIESMPEAAIYVAEDSITLGQIAQTLNALKVSPRDLIAILQAMKEAGAIHAQLELI
jgi:flagellar P-ring protein precursor FlgI